MKKPVIISFYTENYSEYAEQLRASVEKFNFESDILQSQMRGKHWIQNIYWRAEFIQLMLNKHKRDVVWIDSDAEIKRYPVLFDNFPADFGVHFHEWPTSEQYPGGFLELLGGTMYFAFNENVLDLVARWVRLNKEMPLQKRSQLVLQAAVKEWRGRIINLPADYTYIRRLMPTVTDPVIEHYQASGQFRRADEEGFPDVSHV